MAGCASGAAAMGLVLGLFFLQKDLGWRCALVRLPRASGSRARPRRAGHRRPGPVAAGLPWAGPACRAWCGKGHDLGGSRDNGAGQPGRHGLWALATGVGQRRGVGSPSCSSPHGFVLAAIGSWATPGDRDRAPTCSLLALPAHPAARATSTFLVTGVVLVLSVQALVIAAGLPGLVPLSGVVTPFWSFGRSPMLANCRDRPRPVGGACRRLPARALRRPIRTLGAVLGVAPGFRPVAGRWVKSPAADDGRRVEPDRTGGRRGTVQHNPPAICRRRDADARNDLRPGIAAARHEPAGGDGHAGAT